MSKKKSKNKGRDFHGFFIQKRTDKKGRNYYIDQEGKQRSEFDYSLQWSKTGRVNKETFEKTLAQAKKFDIKKVDEARLIADDYETLRRARPLRKKELELMESETTGQMFFYQATDAIRTAIEGGATIKILTPTGDSFRTFKGPKAMDTAHRFISAISKSLAEVQKATKGEIESPMIQFNFQQDIEKNEFLFDFRNISGMEDFTLLSELIRDNFEFE